MKPENTGENSRRSFLKNASMAGASVLTLSGLDRAGAMPSEYIIPKADPKRYGGAGLPITATFLDEISHDIPHQNWGKEEWERDFQHMRSIGIDTVILIRSGYRKFLTYPSDYLVSRGCYKPHTDLLELFLSLAEKYHMNFYFGLYDSGAYWDTGDLTHEIESNRYVIDEVWRKYGERFSSFKGWYLSGEISRKTKGAITSFYELGKQCKAVSSGLPTFISPWIDGKKAVAAASGNLSKKESVSVEEHEREWDEIFDGIHKVVDAVAFQDGHIDYDQLDDFFTVNKKLADKYGMKCWTNAETFDRDMPIKFLPIKFEKLRLKLEAAKRAGYDKAITFEFSHFMSPQSAYLQAGHLYNRYREYFGI
ncbi:DUF4434 domain-containing protein [Sinomicrobium oceani]|uniref:DUF4434 domain-containing protein n=1 Tax=Sinomicrobium oceani TaxID=1150368 RepID=UPI00227A5A54|nr:DUF4434 domain-containing protein [Sinomicrobium oceani]